MPEWAIVAGNWVVDLAKIGAAVLVVYQWFAKPIKEMRIDLAHVKGDTCDLLCDRLTQAHDYHVRKGYCPRADKSRLCSMYERYKAMERNHLVKTYVEDLLALPDEPTRK